MSAQQYRQELTKFVEAQARAVPVPQAVHQSSNLFTDIMVSKVTNALCAALFFLVGSCGWAAAASPACQAAMISAYGKPAPQKPVTNAVRLACEEALLVRCQARRRAFESGLLKRIPRYQKNANAQMSSTKPMASRLMIARQFKSPTPPP